VSWQARSKTHSHGAEANQEQWHAFTRKRRSHNIGYFRYFLSLIFHESTEQIFPDCANPCTRFDPSSFAAFAIILAYGTPAVMADARTPTGSVCHLVSACRCRTAWLLRGACSAE
jgi:hypothetical protein